MKITTKRNCLGLKKSWGGLAKADCVHETIYIDDWLIKFQRPKRDLMANDSDQTRHISLSPVAGPYEDPPYSTLIRDAETIRLVASSLIYEPPRLEQLLPVPHYLMMGIYWGLEKVRPHAELTEPVTDADSLEAYLRADFAHFLEDEGQINWKVRKDIYEELGPQGRNHPQSLIDEDIASNLYYPPVDYERITFNGRTWLRYIWAPDHKHRGGGPDGIWRGLVYCYPFSSGHILSVVFSFTDAYNHGFKKWIGQVVADTETLMNTLTIQKHSAQALADRSADE